MKFKKLFFPICITLLSTSLLSCDDDAPTPGEPVVCNDEILHPSLSNGLVAYYKFASGSLNDMSGNGHHAILVGSPTPTVNAAGSSNCAYYFPGTNSDYLRVASHTDFDFDETTPMTIALWYKPEYVSGTGGDYRVLVARDPGVGLRCPDTYGEYSLGTHDCMQPVFGLGTSRVWDKFPMFAGCDSAMQAWSNAGWHNIIAIFDPAEPTMKWKIYVDGEENLAPALSVGDCSIPYTLSLTGDLVIGKNFIGSIDDIKIYNRAVTNAEITFLTTYVSPCCD